MNLLLDTHVLLWAASDPGRLGTDCRHAIEGGTNDVYVSAVSAWEIAIKQSLGKLTLPRPAELWLPEVVRRTGFQPLPVELEDALRARALPWHHRDPFDRLLIAQALARGLTLVSRDDAFKQYALDVLPG